MRLTQLRFVIFAILVISIMTLGYFCCTPHKNVAKIIAKMPENDRLVLADFFEELIQSDSFGHTLFGNKPVSFLEGIVLGYGRHNALVYQRYHEVTEALLKKKPPPWKKARDTEEEHLTPDNIFYFQVNAQWQKPSEQTDILPRSGFTSLEEEYQHFRTLFHKGAQVHSASPLSCFDYPCFLTDGEDEETETIVSSYVETRRKLAEIYSSGNFLEVSLKKMTGEM
jgi:hypothetical protein